MSEQKCKMKKIIILFLKIIAIEESLAFIIAHYLFEISPNAITINFVIAFTILVTINWYTKSYKKEGYFKAQHIPLVAITLFLTIHLRAGIYWALNTFPLKDANIVLLNLQEPFDDFAYLMIRQYLTTTIPQALAISTILIVFLYTLLGSTQKRLMAIGLYFISTIALLISEIPFSDYIHILRGEPEKNGSYSKFFVENYVNPDSIKITAPEQKHNLILIYLESLETTFSDREHGGFQDTNLIPEITELALQNVSFGKSRNQIGGGFDINGTGATFAAMLSRTLGIPLAANYTNTPILHHYKSLYKILNDNGYHQIFFQGNPGMYREFHELVTDHKVDEVYGTDDLIHLMNLNANDLIKKQGFKNVQDKDAFKFATQILDTISEPFSLTFFTIDTHAPHGLYDPDCIKASDERIKEERLKATARCVSKELNTFLDTLKSKTFYKNTSIIVFGDHLFMGSSLVKGFSDRKWIDIFINPAKAPICESPRIFSDIDMFPTILSSINFDIEGNRLGLGADLFSDKKTLIETLGFDSLNNAIDKMGSHLVYESYLLQKKQQ